MFQNDFKWYFYSQTLLSIFSSIYLKYTTASVSESVSAVEMVREVSTNRSLTPHPPGLHINMLKCMAVHCPGHEHTSVPSSGWKSCTRSLSYCTSAGAAGWDIIWGRRLLPSARHSYLHAVGDGRAAMVHLLVSIQMSDMHIVASGDGSSI